MLPPWDLCGSLSSGSDGSFYGREAGFGGRGCFGMLGVVRVDLSPLVDRQEPPHEGGHDLALEGGRFGPNAPQRWAENTLSSAFQPACEPTNLRGGDRSCQELRA